MSLGNKEDNSKEKECFPEGATALNSTIPTRLHVCPQDRLQVCPGTLPPTSAHLPASFAASTVKAGGDGEAVGAYKVGDKTLLLRASLGGLRTVFFDGWSSKRGSQLGCVCEGCFQVR